MFPFPRNSRWILTASNAGRANLRQTLELDSLDYIDLVVVIENNFAFKVKPEDFTGIISFRDFYDYIQGKILAKEPTDAILAR